MPMSEIDRARIRAELHRRLEKLKREGLPPDIPWDRIREQVLNLKAIGVPGCTFADLADLFDDPIGKAQRAEIQRKFEYAGAQVLKDGGQVWFYFPSSFDADSLLDNRDD
jgi:hypothetical protein